MINIIGDKIYYDGEHVATVNEKAILGYRERFFEFLKYQDFNYDEEEE